MIKGERIELASEVFVNDKVVLTTDADHMDLYLTVEFENDTTPVKATEILGLIQTAQLKLVPEEQAKITQFLLEYSENPQRIPGEQLIASGVPPQHGRDAPIFWGGDPADEQDGPTPEQAEEQEASSVDHYSLSSVVIVKKGEVLLRVGIAVPPEDGSDIYGNLIEANEGRKLTVTAGANTKWLDEQRRTLIAIGEGVVETRGEEVSIQPIIQIDGDVDFGVGNIEFDGAVHVAGSILDGFTVKATRNLYVGGNIEGAFVEVGGDIKITGGITGHNKGSIAAKGTIEAKYINGATAQADHDILVETEIVNSQTTANGMILIKRGGIIGGTATAGYSIQAMTLGSQMYVPTKIRLAEKMLGRKTQRYTKELIEIKTAEARITPVIAKFMKEPGLLKKLPPEKQHAISQLAQQLRELRKRREALTDDAAAYRPQRKTARQIYVGKMCYPKVVMELDGAPLRIIDETKGPIKFTTDKKSRRVTQSHSYSKL